jgi:hypothetical protein
VSDFAGALTRPPAQLVGSPDVAAARHLAPPAAVRDEIRSSRVACRMAERLEKAWHVREQDTAAACSPLSHSIYWKDRRAVFLLQQPFAQTFGLPRQN